MDQVSQSYDNHDHTISTRKTEVVHQQAPRKPYNEPTITVEGQELKVADKFTYLEAVHIDDEVIARIAKASVAFGRLRVNVWERNRIKVDQAENSLQGCCTAKTLFCMCDRDTIPTSCKDKILDTAVLKKAGRKACILS